MKISALQSKELSTYYLMYAIVTGCTRWTVGFDCFSTHLVVNNKDRDVSELLIVAPWKMFVKLAYLPSKLRFSGKYLF